MILKKEGTTYLKGIGILLIMFHNFFHVLNGAPGQNEFDFSQTNFANLIENLSKNPFDIMKQFFSFFGHYTVQIFVFLSGYGLTISYAKKLPSYLFFLKEKWIKVYPLLLGGILIYVVPKFFYTLFFKNDPELLINLIRSSLFKLTLLANFFPDEATNICGPWWFFSLIFQLYLLFPLLFRLNKVWLLIVIFASWILQLIIIKFGYLDISYLRFNSIGHLPEFCLGLYFVKQKMDNIKLPVFLFSLLIFFLGCINQYVWIFSFFAIPFVFLYFYQICDGGSNIVIMYLGNNSMYLFAVHGFLINLFFSFANKSIFFSIIGSILFLLISIVFAYVLKFCLIKITKKFVNEVVIQK